LAKRQDFALHVARPQRIFDLQGGERMHRMRPADGRCPGLADAEKAYLALADKLAHRADRVLDRNGRIDPMDVIEVDDIGLEPPEALLAGFADIFRPAVREARIAEQPEIAKLARDDGIAAVLSHRLGYELLVAAASIAVGGVKKIDADRARPPDCRDPRGAEAPLETQVVSRGTDGSNPSPSSEESANFRSLCGGRIGVSDV